MGLMKFSQSLTGIVIFLLLQAGPPLRANEITEISAPIRRDAGEYPVKIGGAPMDEGTSSATARRTDQFHGWRLPAPAAHRPVHIREIVRMPAPGTWTLWDCGKKSTVSQDKTSCETTWTQYPLGGWLKNEWVICPEDPRGWYFFEVYFDGRLAAKIPFEVK